MATGSVDGQHGSDGGDASENSEAVENGDAGGNGDGGGSGDAEAFDPCDPWHQDCAEGEKCAPVVPVQEGDPDARCVAIAEDPVAAGGVCQTGGGGVDDCAGGSVCHYADTEGTGTCVSLCVGTPDDAGCPDDGQGGEWGTWCQFNDVAGSVPLCLERCDPTASACESGSVCAPYDQAFVCAADEHPASARKEGEVCDTPDQCATGLGCVASSQVPCTDGVSCCAMYCDRELDDPCEAAAVPGLDCMPWMGFDPSTPDDYLFVGACGLF